LIETAKLRLGHKRELRARRIAAYRQLRPESRITTSTK
jgi:hypothetical protein